MIHCVGPTKEHTSVIEISDPITQRTTIGFAESGQIDFIAYQDFAIDFKGSEGVDVSKLMIPERPAYSWSKFINRASNSNTSEVILRVAGVVTPQTEYQFPTPLYLAYMTEEGIESAYVPVVRNSIIQDIISVRDGIPIKFSDGITISHNASTPFFYGLVYEPLGTEISDTRLDVDLTVEGMVENGTVTTLPLWIDISVIDLPASLSANIPDYYGIAISTSDAPEGTYEVVFKQMINGRLFSETLSITVITPSE